MSSSYPPFGNAPARPCQRCGMPLPPNEVYCGNCGQYNVNQLNNSVAQPSSNSFWGAAVPQTSYSSDQNVGPQWGQIPVQAPHIISDKGGIAETSRNGFQVPQNNPVSGYPVPQQPLGPSSQPGNFYGAPTQQPGTNN